MNVDTFSDEKIIASWNKNASPWISAIRNQQIESRRLITNRAIVEAVLSCNPRTIIDLGCGEGWLAHTLTGRGLQVIGIDVVLALIEEARQTVQADFRLLSYEDIANGKLTASVDAIVCNFSLLGKESVEGILRAAPGLLKQRGRFIIQTLHPLMACGDAPYQDGWREGSWAGFSDAFSDPAPWYFRTLESWVSLLQEGKFQLRELHEPIHPKTRKPVSVIMIAELLDV